MKKSTTSLALTVGLLLFIAQDVVHGQDGAPKIETNQVDVTVTKTDEEAARRQERDFQFNEALQDGDRLTESKEFEKALVKYDFVIRNVPPYRPQFDAAKLGIARIKVMQADEALTAKDYEKAQNLLNEAKSLVPDDMGVNRAVVKFNEIYGKVKSQQKNVLSEENNPAITPQLKENIAQVDKLLYEGDRLKETGQYDSAKNRYERVLAVDKYNKSARIKLAELQKLQMKSAEISHDVSRRDAMNQVIERWSEPVLAENVMANRTIELNTTVSNVAKMRRKLEEIIIKDISFNEAPIEDVVSFLTAKSRESDPTGEGVNFVLKQGGAIAPNLSTVAGKGAPAPKSSKIPPVTITLSN
ncbi:MAG: hypothetical protein V4507_07340, partial [Verrucomicrobiota bacterium]